MGTKEVEEDDEKNEGYDKEGDEPRNELEDEGKEAEGMEIT